jgi:hypothetical protein
MPSANRQTDAMGIAPNGSAHRGALETLADKAVGAANESESAGSTTHSETTERTRDGESPAAPEEEGDDGNSEPFLPATPLALAPLSVHIHARVRRFLDRPSKDARVRAAQEQARVSLRVIREAISRYG